MNIHKNDNVLVIAGNARGREGKVLKVFRDEYRAIVEGVNIIKRHTKPSRKNPQGGIVQKEESVSIANLMVVCPRCGKPSRTGRKRVKNTETGRTHQTRVCKKCEETI